MLHKKDDLKAIQPFFVLSSPAFKQAVYLRQGISHFYSFKITNAVDLVTVPDGCIDLLFEYSEYEMRAYACGTVLSCSTQYWEENREIFGIRFLPGNHPAGVNVLQKDLINKRLLLDDLVQDRTIIERMSKEKDFHQRIRIFLEEYTHFERKQEKPYGKMELCITVKEMAYQTDGTMRIQEMADRTGYTTRYLNKVFMEFMGFSPKVFCKIIQFQRALDTLNGGVDKSMTEVAVDLGYYDQPQFIREFREFAGITPNQYLKLIQENDYKRRIENL